jgi:hypothetical protein
MCGCRTPTHTLHFFTFFCLTSLILYDIMTTRRPMKQSIMIHIYTKHHHVNNGFFLLLFLDNASSDALSSPAVRHGLSKIDEREMP